MTQRPHRLRTAARQLHMIRFTADLRAEMAEWDDADEWPDEDGGPTCGHCGAGLLPLEDGECWHCGDEL